MFRKARGHLYPVVVCWSSPARVCYMVSTTTPKKQAVGAELRKARGDKVSQRQMASRIGVSHVTLRRWENGEVLPRPEDVATILEIAGVPLESREEIIALAREPDETRWLAVGMPGVRQQLNALLDIESIATAISIVGPLLVPGLLQTRAYARTVMERGGVPASEINNRVTLRIGRRDAIARAEDPVRLNAYVGETVLRHRIGGAKVMADQLRFLVEAEQWPNVHLRVIPEEADWHPGLEGMFSITEFPDRTPVVHLETRISGLYLHEPPDVAAYQEGLARVHEIAMSPEDSSRLIEDSAARIGETRA